MRVRRKNGDPRFASRQGQNLKLLENKQNYEAPKLASESIKDEIDDRRIDLETGRCFYTAYFCPEPVFVRTQTFGVSHGTPSI